MAIEVLQSRDENREARRELRRRGLDFASSWVMRFLKKKVLGTIAVGDRSKNWDVLRSLDFLAAHVPPAAPVLDLGAYSSEVLYALQRMGYSDLSGIDLNPDIVRMPSAGQIRYHVGNFLQAPFSEASFAAITAISVVEHGFSSGPLLRELSRLLRPGGYFIASVDYWPEKIDTDGIRVFGLDWTIFSREEMLAFVDQAGFYGFSSPGRTDLDARERTVQWQGKGYTFAWIVLQKDRPSPPLRNE